MANRGVHFAIKQVEYEKLKAIESDEKLIEFIEEELEEIWDEAWLYETDKAWDAIHRSLTDGKLEWESGEFPLNEVIIGGENLYKGDYYIVCTITPENVHLVSKALEKIDKEILKKGYNQISPSNYDGEKGEEDFEYTWSNFKGVPEFFKKSALDNRAILFTVDL